MKDESQRSARGLETAGEMDAPADAGTVCPATVGHIGKAVGNAVALLIYDETK